MLTPQRYSTSWFELAVPLPHLDPIITIVKLPDWGCMFQADARLNGPSIELRMPAPRLGSIATLGRNLAADLLQVAAGRYGAQFVIVGRDTDGLASDGRLLTRLARAEPSSSGCHCERSEAISGRGALFRSGLLRRARRSSQ